MSTKKSTYGTIAKWFKWASMIIILVPIVELVLIGICLSQGNDINNGPEWFNKGIGITLIIAVVCSIIWVILNIIMFFAAGTVKKDGASPLKIRIALLISLILVFAPIILGVINAYVGLNWAWAYWVAIFAPTVGWIMGEIIGAKLQHNL